MPQILKHKKYHKYNLNGKVSGKYKGKPPQNSFEPRITQKRLLLHNRREYRLRQIHLPWNPAPKGAWDQVYWRACFGVAEPLRQKYQYAVKILQRTNQMGFFFPNLCYFHTHSKTSLGHPKVPKQNQNIGEKHPRRQIRVFWTHEGSGIHGLSRIPNFPISLPQFRTHGRNQQNQNYLP